jgi:Cys-rich repeat protein
VAQDSFSIFSVGVQGTLTGMSRLRSVAGPDPNMTGYDGRTILAVLSENWDSGVCMADAAQSGAPTAEVQLCSSDTDCPTGQTCNLPASTPPAPCSEPACTSTTTANVQFQGSREEGDQITIPLP